MENKEFNSILRSIGQQSETGRQLKEYTENVLFHVLKRHSDQNATRFQPYGSAAEDLKCVQPSDIGDVDVVIFPCSENLMVHEDMIEYSENPMHVRIKGTDHPVLQSCLLEGSEYVATSALKNFHPGIYGSSISQFSTFLGHTTQLMSRKETSSFGRSHYHVKNSITSPALTVNFEKEFDTLSECFQSLKDPQDVANFDSTSLESMVLRKCTARELDFARAYSEVANELTDFSRKAFGMVTSKAVLSKTEVCHSLERKGPWKDIVPTMKLCMISVMLCKEAKVTNPSTRSRRR